MCVCVCVCVVREKKQKTVFNLNVLSSSIKCFHLLRLIQLYN